MPGGFVAIDAFMQRVAEAHGAYEQTRRARIAALFVRHDANGDGVFSLSEFEAMLREVMPLVTKPNAVRLYRQAIAQSRHEKFAVGAFEAMILSNAGGLGAGGHFIASKRAALLELGDHNAQEQQGDDAVQQVAQLWNSMNEATVADPGLSPERMDEFVDNWQTIVQVQAMARRLLVRARARVAATNNDVFSQLQKPPL